MLTFWLIGWLTIILKRFRFESCSIVYFGNLLSKTFRSLTPDKQFCPSKCIWTFSPTVLRPFLFIKFIRDLNTFSIYRKNWSAVCRMRVQILTVSVIKAYSDWSVNSVTYTVSWSCWFLTIKFLLMLLHLLYCIILYGLSHSLMSAFHSKSIMKKQTATLISLQNPKFAEGKTLQMNQLSIGTKFLRNQLSPHLQRWC